MAGNGIRQVAHAALAEFHAQTLHARPQQRCVSEFVVPYLLQEIEVRYPVIQVGGTSLISGMVRAMEDTLGQRPIVPPHSQYIGAAGAALLASGFLEGH